MHRASGKTPIVKGLKLDFTKGNSKYPWPDMEVGDSFQFSTDIKSPGSQVTQANTRYADSGKEWALGTNNGVSYAQRIK